MVNQERDEKLEDFNQKFASAERTFEQSTNDYKVQLGHAQTAFSENLRSMQDIHRKVTDLAEAGPAHFGGGGPRERNVLDPRDVTNFLSSARKPV